MSDTSVTNSLLVSGTPSATMSPWQPSSTRTDTLISLTPVAAAKIRELMAEEEDAGTLVLRVAIQGGGCSGFQYGLGFDAGAAEGDVELTSRESRLSSTRTAPHISVGRPSTS